MVKRSKRAPFEIAGHTIEAGNSLTFNLEAPDLYTHTGMSIPVRVIHGTGEGPVLFLSGAVHGDEINGVEIIRRVLASNSLGKLRGTVIAVPVVNIFGFINQERYLPDRRDLNRVFPGSEKGSLASRMAYLFVSEILSRCTHGIDLHTAAINRENLPQIRAVLDDEETILMAEAFGLPVIINTKIIEGSLRETAEKLDVKVLVYEAGEALRFDELSIRGGVNGILSVMRAIDMLPRSRRKPPAEAYVAKRSYWVRAEISGIHRSICALGAAVKRGEVLGYLSDPLGEIEVPVVAGAAGLVIGRATIPLITEGEALFHIATFEERDSDIANDLDETEQYLDRIEAAPPIV